MRALHLRNPPSYRRRTLAHKNSATLGVTFAISALAFAGHAYCQEQDNGTDPTKLRRSAIATYEHLDLGHDASRGTFKAQWENPVSDRLSLRFTVPVVGYDAPGLSSSYDIGDVALRATYLADVKPTHGIVFQGEIIADTAGRPELGYNATVGKVTAIYAKFLPGGRIFAPAINHAQDLGGDNDVSETTIDFYYVPKLANPALYMTIDPAVIHNWEGSKTYGSLAVTTGRAVGRVGSGLAQVYIKPSILMGNERPADWGVEIGFRAIGF